MRLRNNKVTKLFRYVGAIMLYPVFAFWAVLTLSVMGKLKYSSFFFTVIEYECKRMYNEGIMKPKKEKVKCKCEV